MHVGCVLYDILMVQQTGEAKIEIRAILICLVITLEMVVSFCVLGPRYLVSYGNKTTPYTIMQLTNA